MIDSLESYKCTGCKACGNVCPKSAIFFEDDNEGFWYPKILTDRCMNCGLCENVCPAINKNSVKGLMRSLEPKTLEVINLDDEVRLGSTSGGVYYALAKKFINSGGFIVGCSYDHDLRGAHHEMVSDLEGLNRLYGSKYFQSDTRMIYREIKEQLDCGKNVLFCGAPCQVAGLYTYLKKDYDKLYTLDFICRGINSPKAYRAYMSELKRKYKSDIAKVHFKNKSHGWTNLGTRVEFKNGKVYYRNRYTDPWVNGFIRGNLYMRPSCSECEYKEMPRVADLSFGDFWGLPFSKEDAFKGVSLVFINSEKGKSLFEQCESDFKIRERDLQTALKGNPAILNKIPIGSKRKEFFNNIDSVPFSKLVWKLMNQSSPIWQFKYVAIVIKQFLKNCVNNSYE